MAEPGGYRRPGNPAPVSGPGAMSARTDGGPADSQPMRALPDAGYGEQAEFMNIQAGAPMAAEGPPPGMMPVGIDAPSMRPEEPITAGAAMGPGPGPENLPSMQSAMTEDMRALTRYLPMLQRRADNPDAPQAFRMFVRYLKGYRQS